MAKVGAKTKALAKVFRLPAGEKMGPKYKKRVPCALGLDDVKEKSDRIVEALGEKKVEKEALSLAGSSHRKNINNLDKEMEALRAQIATGTEEREVYVADRKNYRGDVVETYRLDTNEMVESREMTGDERQEMLPKVGRARRGARAAENAGEGDGEPAEPEASAEE